MSLVSVLHRLIRTKRASSVFRCLLCPAAVVGVDGAAAGDTGGGTDAVSATAAAAAAVGVAADLHDLACRNTTQQSAACVFPEGHTPW